MTAASTTELTPYGHDERAKARLTYRRMEALAEACRSAAERGLTLPEAERKVVEAVTGTSDLNRQKAALDSVAGRVKGDHLGKLNARAVRDFGAFCEVINPEEPPESPWHVWLTDYLQGMEMDPNQNKLVLNVPPGHAKPLHVDTPILMGDYSYKRLGDVEVGDSVITHTGAAREVTAVHDQGELKLVKITTAAGREVLAEATHPFMIEVNGQTQWKKAGQLVVGHRLCAEVGNANPYAGDETDEARVRALMVAKFKGYMSTGGAITNQKSNKPPYGVSPDLRISTAKRSIMREVKALADALAIKMSICAVTSQTTFVGRPSTADYRVMNQSGWFSFKPEDRRVPAELFGADDVTVAAFLSGALSIRAEVIRREQGKNLRLRHRSQGLMRDLQRLIARLGAHAAITLPDADFGGAYFLLLDDRAIDILKAAGVSFCADVEERFAVQPPLGPRHKPSDVRRDKVVSVEPAGKGACRCLTVDIDSSFTADTLIVHNSTYASRLFVSWRLGRDPDQRIIGGGHSQNFVENEFSKKIRDLVGSPEYQGVFPEVKVSHDTRAAQQWGIAGRKGQYVARGVGQGIHGFRATFICVDDPYSKIEDAQSAVNRKKVELWFDGDIGSRALPGCKIFLIMTRFHGEDLTHHLEEMNQRLPEALKWKIVTVPAICFDEENDLLGRSLGEVLWSYYNHEYFVGKKIEFGFIGFSLTYQQVSSASNPDNIASNFQYWEALPHLTEEALRDCILDANGRPIENREKYIRRTVVSVDTAAKTTERADYTVVQCWMESRDGKHYLVDQARGKWELPDMTSQIERMAKNWKADVILVEDKGQGTAYLQARGETPYQKRMAPAPLVPINPGQQGKEFRLDAVSMMITGGDVYLPKNAPWVEHFLVETGQFPDGAHDDQVDAMSQYLAYARANKTRFGSKKVTSRG